MALLPVLLIALWLQQQIHHTAANAPCPSLEKEIFMQCKLATLFALFAALLAPAAHAQFGSGIVYDPMQSAHALQQIEQASQLYTTAVATRNQIVTMYNLAHQMAQMPQNLAARYRADWSQWTSLQAPGNTYGNMSALVNALNYGALVNAQQGYTKAYVQVQNYPTSSYSSLDSRTQATVANQYATSELAQTTTTNTLATLGTIRSNSQAFTTKLSNLESDHIEAGKRFIENQQFGIVQQGRCDQHPLAHSSRVGRNGRVLPGVEMQKLEQTSCFGFDERFPESAEPADQLQVFQSGKVTV
jgi:hypothetical protein